MGKNIYLGYVIEKEWMKKYPAASPAGNNFQIGFIEAWKKKKNIQVYSILPVASWPQDDRIVITKSTEKNKLEIKVLPFINIKFLKEISIMISVAKTIRRECKAARTNQINIITYNGNGPVSLPVLWLKKKYKFNYICLVVDPPLYQGTTDRKGKIWNYLYKKLSDSFMKAARECDICVVLNAYFAKEYLKRDDFYVLDCGINLRENEVRKDKKEFQYWEKDDNIHMVFTGMLHEHSGIMRFIDMFEKIEIKGLILHIFGKGIYEEKIKNISEKSSKIVYHGYIDNDLIREIQQHADILICPNTIDHPINKVAFPSKIQEYMLSGVPVLATEVNGLGKEYYPYLYTYDDTLEGLKKTMLQLLEDGKDVRIRKAFKAKQFIIQEKNWDTQIEKLMCYLDSNLKHQK